MSYQALARKWRPKTFAEVVGQEHVVAALVNGLDNQRVHHAFLFTGTRGVGKTTLARIFARALNCEKGVTSAPCGKCAACAGVDDGNFIDLIEVDAASRTKVDDTRELLDNVQYTPTQGRFKIYLIDEVHMLSTHSFNALLKTLEEPPEHVKFLLATTDPQKLPPTILSRCIQFNLKAMEIGRLGELLEKILKEESVAHDRAALLILARAANGSVRDALSLLDQGIAYGNGEVREAAMRAMLGMIEQGFTGKLLAQICDGESEAALETVAAMALRSVDFAAALDEILSALHNAALCQVNPKALEWKGADSGEAAELAARDAELLQLLYQIALLGKRDLALAPDPRSGFEMALLRMIAFRPVAESDAAAPGTAAGVSAGNLAKTGAGRPAAAEKSPRKNADGNGAEEKAPRKSAGENGAAENPHKNGVENGANGDISGETGKIIADIAELRDGARWGAFIAQSGLSGLELEMVMHMLPESVAENTVHLTLDAEHEHLLDRGRMEEIERRLAERCEFPLKLAVRVGKITAEQSQDGGTPAARNDRGRAARQQAAEEAFHHDPKVQELVNLFDAEVVGDSIRPPVAPESSNDKPAD